MGKTNTYSYGQTNGFKKTLNSQNQASFFTNIIYNVKGDKQEGGEVGGALSSEGRDKGMDVMVGLRLGKNRGWTSTNKHEQENKTLI